MYLQKNIKFLRKKANLTLVALGEKLGKNAVTVSDYEKGKAAPPMEVCLQLAEIFQVSLDDLVRTDLTSQAPTKPYKKEDDDEPFMRRLVELLEQRVKSLEREIARRDPEMARDLGLDEK